MTTAVESTTAAPVTSIVVYGQPGCMPCKATCRALDKQGLTYAYVDVQADDDALAHIRELGYQATPVVQVTRADGDVDHWGQFRRERIRDLVG